MIEITPNKNSNQPTPTTKQHPEIDLESTYYMICIKILKSITIDQSVFVGVSYSFDRKITPNKNSYQPSPTTKQHHAEIDG